MSRRAITLALAMFAGGLLVVGGAVDRGSIAEAAVVSDEDWLGILNTYRAQSGLDPVVENSDWSAGARNHSCWVLLNGLAHDETPGTPGYTTSGDAAGNAGNVAGTGNAATTARQYIDSWIAAPFHAVGMLRTNLRSSGFGSCTNPPNSSILGWKSAATLDVIRGFDQSAPRPSAPVVFPGDGATTSLTRFRAEYPDPRTFCNWSGQRVGLPLIALMPSKVTSASATLSGPAGPIGTCVLHGSNTDGTAKAILAGDNAVVVIPSAPLATGAYTVSVASNGGDVTWSFNVDPDAPLTAGTQPPPPPAPAALPELRDTAVLSDGQRLTTVTPFRFADSRLGRTITRLPAQTQVRFKVAGAQGIPADASSISANITVDQPSGAGYLTASDCSGSSYEVSTLNYAARDSVANQSIIPLAQNGDLCLYSYEATDVVIDVNGFASPNGSSKLAPISPVRLVDTRGSDPLRAGTTRSYRLTGAGGQVPSDAKAVALNLTAVHPSSSGWIVAYPCGVSQPESSTINVWARGTRANSAVVPLPSDGRICLRSTVTTDILIDVTGWITPSGNFDFTPLRPLRIADTRSQHPGLNQGADGRPLAPGAVLRVPVAGVRGIPGSAKAATLNVTAAGAANDGFLMVVPCGTTSDTSTVNFRQSRDVGNGTTIELGPEGAVCVTTSHSAHVIVDITGIWD